MIYQFATTIALTRMIASDVGGLGRLCCLDSHGIDERGSWLESGHGRKTRDTLPSSRGLPSQRRACQSSGLSEPRIFMRTNQLFVASCKSRFERAVSKVSKEPKETWHQEDILKVLFVKKVFFLFVKRHYYTLLSYISHTHQNT